jgi:DNA-directed RNA polymerase specialized sigma24 family protein
MGQHLRTNHRAEAWSLNGEAFDQLLHFLDADRDAAARKYEEVRGRLLKLFAWRGCTAPEDYADRVIDRVARRVVEGAAISVAEPYQYFRGVALNVLREHWREPARAWQPIAAVQDAPCLATSPAWDHDAGQAAERQLSCLECCLGALPQEQRTIVVEYHAGPGQIARRRALSQRLDIPMNALRIRVHRLRTALEGCVGRCVSARSAR